MVGRGIFTRIAMTAILYVWAAFDKLDAAFYNNAAD
jgi:hypothetical protein